MTKKNVKNGWKRIIFIAVGIGAIGGAVAVLKPFVPWAPKELVGANFAAAAENTLDRWRTELIKLVFLAEQAKNSGDRASEASWKKQILTVQSKIDELVDEKARRR